MDAREASALAKAVIERLAPKVPSEDEAAFVRRSAWAGEPAIALSELVAILVDERVPVTSRDRDDLRRLLAEFGETAKEVDRMIIAEDNAS